MLKINLAPTACVQKINFNLTYTKNYERVCTYDSDEQLKRFFFCLNLDMLKTRSMIYGFRATERIEIFKFL